MEPISSPSEASCHLPLRIRPIRPSDKQKLADGFGRLSAESRHQRFFIQKNALTAEELHRFTELDGHDHFALGAFELSETGDEGDAIGVARFIRLTEEPAIAELAVAVVDDRQGLGIGRTLLQRLLEAARDRGIKRIRCYVLAENERMRRLAAGVLGKAASLRREGEILVGDFSIPGTATSASASLDVGTEALFGLLRLVASGAVIIPAMCALATIQRTLKIAAHGLDVFDHSLWRGRMPNAGSPANAD